MEASSILIINAFLYLLTLFFYIKKKKEIDLGTVCLFTFLLSSFGSVWYYSFDNVHLFYPDINISALLFIYIAFIIFTLPLLKIRYRNIKDISTQRYNNTLHFLSAFFAIIAIPVFLNLIFNFFQKSYGGNALNSMYESGVDNAELIFLPGIKVCYSFMRRFYDLIVFLLCYNLYVKSRLNIIIGLVLSVISFFMVAFQGGSRGGIIMEIMVLGGCVLLFYHLYSNKVRKYIKITGVCLCSLLVAGITAISISRFDANDTRASNRLIDQWIAQYLGEGMVRFSDDCFPIKDQLNGDKNFSYIKSLVGFHEEYDNEKANLKYESKLGIPTSVFYTFIGSFYLDFHFIGTLVLAFCVHILMNKLSRRINETRMIGFIEILIIIKFFKMISTGFTSNVFAVTSIQRDEFIFWIFIAIISLISVSKESTPTLR